MVTEWWLNWIWMVTQWWFHGIYSSGNWIYLELLKAFLLSWSKMDSAKNIPPHLHFSNNAAYPNSIISKNIKCFLKHVTYRENPAHWTSIYIYHISRFYTNHLISIVSIITLLWCSLLLSSFFFLVIIACLSIILI